VRLMVTLRIAFIGPAQEECSFLFMVEGRGRPAMGLHHDGDVESFWLQIEGRRTVTIGPPVPPGTPEDLPPGWPPPRGRGPALMPSRLPGGARALGRDSLVEHGVLALRDLPLVILPADPAALDGWGFRSSGPAGHA